MNCRRMIYVIIEDIFQIDKKGTFVTFAQVQGDRDWQIREGSYIGDVELDGFLEIPRRIVKETGQQDYNFYMVRLSNDRDIHKSSKGAVLVLKE